LSLCNLSGACLRDVVRDTNQKSLAQEVHNNVGLQFRNKVEVEARCMRVEETPKRLGHENEHLYGIGITEKETTDIRSSLAFELHDRAVILNAVVADHSCAPPGERSDHQVLRRSGRLHLEAEPGLGRLWRERQVFPCELSHGH